MRVIPECFDRESHDSVDNYPDGIPNQVGNDSTLTSILYHEFFRK